MTQTDERVLALVAAVAKRHPASVKLEQLMVADLGIDSVHALELLCHVEEAFKVEAPEDAVEKIQTVGDISAMVGRLQDEKVLALVAAVAKKDPASVKPEQHLIADLGIDSVQALKLLCDVEEAFKVEAPEDAVEKIETVSDVLAMVRSLQAGAGAAQAVAGSAE